jgi:hypothetical protein
VNLTGQQTIPAGVLVQPGPILSGQALRSGEAIANAFDPRVSGLSRPVGSIVYTRDGSIAYRKATNVATGWELWGATAAPPSVVAPGAVGPLLARSAAALPAGFGYVFDDLFDVSLTSSWYTNGTWAASATKGPGVWVVNSGAFGIIQRIPLVVLAANPAVTPWHVACRMAMTGAVVAGDIKGCAISSTVPSTNSCSAGIRQSVSATKFVFAATKAGVQTTALSTVSIDGNFHVLEILSDGVTMYGSVDSETPVTVIAAVDLPTVVSFERHGVEAGTGNLSENHFDFTYAAAGRTAA